MPLTTKVMFQTGIQASTKIDFPSGITLSHSKVIFITEFDKDTRTWVVVTENTPFHPVNYKWSDQPGDTGTVTIDGHKFDVLNTLTCGFELASHTFYLDTQIPVRKGENGWFFVVAHIVKFPSDYSSTCLTGKTVILEVNAERREQLSIAHSSCHLSALALNKCTSKFWSKECQKDSLANYNLDQLAIQKSQIKLEESNDFYRLGKSLKKKGFDTVAFFSQILDIEICINKQLAEWLKLDSPIKIEPQEAKIDDHRVWTCQLQDGLAKIPCGGTHVKHLKQILSINVSLEVMSNEPEFVMYTTVKPRS
ncbi:hypothetical protein DP113_09360 [Brasilonema octagenarum UFV-E1]|uniref:Alanyl-tRNA synthetase n=2 Tax=Brasilonema TaxID=383614 RepID=A0A856MBM9_9CYAN|nr:hypothetical protein DP114_09405 [Brasilonema sennae CENA114]QDL14451.1 hypothetical protein DP113_09360 [Brasilonema octagenarum UFV-E1]